MLGMDGVFQRGPGGPAVRKHDAVGQQQAKHGARSADSRVELTTYLLDDKLRNSCAYNAEYVIQGEFTAAPHALNGQTKHP